MELNLKTLLKKHYRNHKMKNKIIGILLAITLLLGLFTWLDNRSVVFGKPEFKEELKENEKEKIIVNLKKKTVTKIVRLSNGKMEKSRTEGVREVEVTISNTGQSTVTCRNRGLLFEPGLSLFYSKNQMNLGLDFQWVYWRKYGIDTGFGISRSSKCSAYLASSFNFYSNSYFLIGINDEIKPVVGVKISF